MHKTITKKSYNGFFTKNSSGQHNFLNSRKNSHNRSINSQTRALRTSQNDSIAKKLYVQIKDLRDDIKMRNYFRLSFR